MPKIIDWTEEMDEYIFENFGKIKLDDIAKILKVSHTAIKRRVNTILPNSFRNNKPWTDVEDEFLFKYYGKMDTGELSNVLKRSKRAIKDHIFSIEKTKKPDVVSGNYTVRDISEIMGVDITTVHLWIGKNKIPYVKPERNYLFVEHTYWGWLKDNLHLVNFNKVDDYIKSISPEWYKLELSKEHREKFRYWTNQEEIDLWEMFTKGHSYQEMASKFNRTCKSITHKINNLRNKKMKKVS